MTGRPIQAIAPGPGLAAATARPAGEGTEGTSAGPVREGAGREGRNEPPLTHTLTLADGTRARRALALLAGHPGGLSTPLLAQLGGDPPGRRGQSLTGTALRYAEAAGWVRRAGKTPGGHQQGPAVIWDITGAGREALAWAEAPRSGRTPASSRERPRRPEHPWADDAEERTRAGESVASTARRHGVDAGTVERALDRRGVPHGRAARPGWASDAKTRYEAGESALALARCYGVSRGKVAAELRKQGVQTRTRKQAWRARRARQATQAPPGQAKRPDSPRPREQRQDAVQDGGP